MDHNVPEQDAVFFRHPQILPEQRAGFFMRGEMAVLDRELELFRSHPDIVALGRQFGDAALLLDGRPAGFEVTPDNPVQPLIPEPVPQVTAVAEAATPYPRLFSAYAIPELAARRASAHETASAIYEKRMQHLRDGEYDIVPQAVDPLSTAARVIEAERLHGRDSLEYKTWYDNLLTDSSRLLEEAGSKGETAYFLPLRQEYNTDTDGYEFKGRVLQEMVADGITPIAEQEENKYRIGEYVEEAISPVVRTLGRTMLLGSVELPVTPQTAEEAQPLPEAVHADISVHTIAECADWALALYDRLKDDEQALANADFQGYVPKNNKMMLRSVRYDNRRNVRYLEQVAIPGYAPEVILEFEYRTGILERGQTPDKVTRRGTQIIDPEGLGALDIVQMLDDIAGELSGKAYFMGQEVGPQHPRDYAVIPAQALAREQKFETDKYVLANHLITLEEQGTDHFVANGLVANFVKELLLEKVKADPAQAEIIFDKRTADNIRDYVAHQKAGNATTADDLWNRIKAQAPAVEFCTGGSCGLVSVSSSSAEGLKARDLLGAGTDEEILRDTQRACPDCDEYEVVYTSSGSKGCLNCGKKEIKK